MLRSDLFFDLPQDLIAQEPTQPRDHCRLMVLDRSKQTIQHHRFYELPSFLRSGDMLIFNQSKVLPARLLARRGSGAQVELLLLRDLGGGVWSCLIGGKATIGETLQCLEGLRAQVLARMPGQEARVQFSKQGQPLLDTIQRIGLMPTPPYIKKTLQDPALYQTIFAKDTGSAAAPTAGLHFTQTLLDKLKQTGVEQEFVTLHVGLGTFQPVKTKQVEDHPIHSECYSVDRAAFERVQRAKRGGRRLIAVGTTSVRVLETLFSLPAVPSEPETITGETSLFIYPGYSFKVVDALITNFHTPYSSLLALVYAFAGEGFTKQAYSQAIKERYRFFSFGDAMFIQ